MSTPGAASPEDLERLRAALAERYVVGDVLGTGGMATVVRAEDRKHRRTVAIKLLRSDLSASLGSDRFLREIGIAATLQHPRILPLYDSGEADGLLYYVMPLVEGDSLRRRLQREGPLPIDDAVRIAREVAAALAYAHEHGVVHRDIKPDNILFSGGEAVVADFGIARAVDAAHGASLTVAGMTLGTPEYMSPEQVTGESEADARSDIYSLGCMLYEMLTGRAPYVAPSIDRILMQHLAAPIPQVRTLQPAVPASVEAAVARAMAKAPEHRFASARDFAAALAPAGSISRESLGGYAPTSIPDMDAGHRTEGSVEAAVAPAGRLGARARAWGNAGAAAALALVITALVVARSRREEIPVSSNAIAVLPFRVSGDTAFTFLREGMVDLLTTQLGSTTSLRPIDSRSVMAAWVQVFPRGGDPSREQVRAVARRLGSRLVVLGEVVGASAGISISARILDVSTGRQTEARVQGATDSLYPLLDRLTAQLLAQRAGEPTRRLSELASTSPRAMREYLEGRMAYRRGELKVARDRFSEALSLDSTFALAALGMASTGAWSPQAGVTVAVRRGLLTGYALRQRLNQSDRLQFEAYVIPDTASVPSAAMQLAAWRRAVEASPGSAETQFEYGDRLFHDGESLGESRTMARAEAAFARAFALDSSYSAPLAHLVEAAARARDRQRTRQLESLFRREAAGADVGDYVRWRAALTLGDDTTLEALRRGWPTIRLASLNRILGFGQADGVALSDVDQAAIELRRRLDDGSVGGIPFMAGQTLHSLSRNRGRDADADWAAGAMRVADAALPATSIVYLNVAAVPVLDALFWDGDSLAAASAVRQLELGLARATSSAAGASPRTLGDACVVALWRAWFGLPIVPAHRERLQRALATRRAAAAAGMDPLLCLTMLDALAVPAHGAAVTAGASRAAALLQAMLLTGPYVFGADFGHLVLARALERLGDQAGALQAVRRRPYDWDTAPLYLSTYLREAGRLAARQGDLAGAAEAYDRYLALRDGSDARHRARTEEVQRARAALARTPLPAGAQTPRVARD